jgi:hypothetical protein
VSEQVPLGGESIKLQSNLSFRTFINTLVFIEIDSSDGLAATVLVELFADSDKKFLLYNSSDCASLSAMLSSKKTAFSNLGTKSLGVHRAVFTK